MKTRKCGWNWAGIAACLAFMLHAPVGVKAQDTQAVQYPQSAPDAQNPPSQPQDANTPDPPSRVARLNYMDGSVSFQPGGENDWVTAVLNRPLVTGDNLWADEDSRAEVHIGSTALRLAAKTGITLLDVSDRTAQIRLAQGSLIVKVRHVDDEDSYEIDTPNVAFVIAQPGDYRIDVNEDGGRTDVTVWRGRGEVTGGGSSYTVVANQYATFTGTDHLDYDLGQIPGKDGFDAWALDRDQREDQSDSANYVSREMTGYEDLDEYGDWSYVADYGTCWRPRVLVAGWTPYRFGHWSWVGPWGWTWVEDEPWGFAPFHYGRWAFAGTGWLWVPGPSVVRPVYAPALVAWVGGGPGFNFSFSFGAGVGWFPLAPGEVFIPGYRVSRVYVNNVNFTNTRVNLTRVTNVYNMVVINRSTMVNNITYANRNVNGGVTVVSRDTFVNARPVARSVVSVTARELAAAPVSERVGVEPGRTSVLGAGKPVTNKPPAAVTSRPVVALRTPAPMPHSLDQRQAQADGHLNQQSSLLVRQEAAGRPVPMNPQTRPTQSPTQSSSSTKSDDGFRSFGPPSGGSGQAKPQARVWEAQGTPEPEKKTNAQPANSAQHAQQWSHPLAKPVAPVQPGNERQQREQEQKFSTWQQQRPAASAPAPRQQNSHPPAESHASSPKKGN
jgi:FecR protein